MNIEANIEEVDNWILTLNDLRGGKRVVMDAMLRISRAIMKKKNLQKLGISIEGNNFILTRSAIFFDNVHISIDGAEHEKTGYTPYGIVSAFFGRAKKLYRGEED